MTITNPGLPKSRRTRGNYSPIYFTALVFIIFTISFARSAAPSEPEALRSIRVELPNQENNVIKTSWPAIACWFWHDEDLAPEGYKAFVDLYEKYTPFGLLTASLRAPGQLTDPKLHDQFRAAAEYSLAKGMGMVLDLDLRLARTQFKERYPDELQQLVLLREMPVAGPLAGSGTVSITVESPGYSDHYTPASRPKYYPVSSELLRVYAYKKGVDGRITGPVADITDRARSVPKKDALEVTVACDRTACALVAVTLYTPAVFAPHLLSYQREILAQYADAPLAGACKDEWGFPGRFDPSTSDLWYSPFMAKAYGEKRPGHDLLRDMLLMSVGEEGREAERTAAVNAYMEMYWQRNGEIETDYYYAVKEYFGQDAMSATHPTWFPYPGRREIFKNGLSWWVSKRDLAQTDECTPYPARTALAKKWQSPLWYNMFYSTTLEEYDLWSHALGGGRINYHPLYPRPAGTSYRTNLLSGGHMRAESRVQLLNFISTVPIDCPVAVVFGHPAALNWADSANFADTGMRVADELWKEGFYADLIPSSEITSGALHVSPNGKIQYGPQEYEAVVFYHPQYEKRAVASFFTRAAEGGGTALWRVGDWSVDFEGGSFDGNAALPANMKALSAGKCAGTVIAYLREKGVSPQTPCTARRRGFEDIMVPNPAGSCRLIDGTVIIISAEKTITGDPIRQTFTIGGREVFFDAVGVAAVRLDKSGNPEAIAAGGMKSFRCGDMSIELAEPVDLALWRDSSGEWQGILQGHSGPLPEALTKITQNWTRLRLPEVYNGE